MNTTADRGSIYCGSSNSDTPLASKASQWSCSVKPDPSPSPNDFSLYNSDFIWAEPPEGDWLLFPEACQSHLHAQGLWETEPTQCGKSGILSNHGRLEEGLRELEKYMEKFHLRRGLDAGRRKTERPLNAFILYRIAFRHVAEQVYCTKDQRLVSKKCGDSWRKESDRIKDWFRDKAQTRWQSVKSGQHG
ncbi:hypothetical protein FDECE_18460 [Fusarium decemcellulare]|nr:hypothetical protein FDECE_18460 [Fusarium decemcellulare]